MKDGYARFDTLLVFLYDINGLLGFLPGLRRVAEDEEGIGNDVQFLAPFDKVVKIIDIDFLVDDFVPHPF